VEIVTEKDHFVHVSGHPARDELAEMYRWVKPAIAVPVHGELRHLRAHVALAESCQVRQSVLVENGSILRLAPGQPEVISQVASGRLGLDGTQLTAMGGPALKMRQRMAHNGTAVATIILDRGGRLQGEPLLTLHGLAAEPEEEAAAKLEAAAAARQALASLPQGKRGDDPAVREVVRIAVRRSLNQPYFEAWDRRRSAWWRRRAYDRGIARLEARVRRFGYSLSTRGAPVGAAAQFPVGQGWKMLPSSSSVILSAEKP